MRLILGVVLTLVCAHPTFAQERLSPNAFIDIADGHTLTFRHHPSGQLVGIEEFLSHDRTVWARDDGTCTYGRIILDGLYICFRYEDDPGVDHCWIPYDHADGMLVWSSDDVQHVTSISDRPVVCEGAPLS